MLRIFRDNFVPKYKSGKWIFDAQTLKFKFISKAISKHEPETVLPIPIQISSFKFKPFIDQVEELIFRKKFMRSAETRDGDVITIADIKILVLYLAPSTIMKKPFLDFFYLNTFDKFLNALIIYFEYFLKIVEFLLIRRDETKSDLAKLQTLESVNIKKMLSEYLAQYRLLVAREYSKIVMGTHDMPAFHHLAPIINISQTGKDQNFHEAFLSFSTHAVWIAMHRRAYTTIDYEINRLFRSGHFNMTDHDTDLNDYIQFNKTEQQILYGKNDKRSNFRAQRSPCIQEIASIRSENLPILWIGEKKYRGTNKRFCELEMEFVVPDSQLVLIGVTHGILGHPKAIYDTMLSLDWTVLRYYNYTKDYDPYNLINQPYIKFPNWDEFKTKKETFESYFNLKKVHHNLDEIIALKRLWLNRNKIVQKIKDAGIANDVILNCQKEIDELKNPQKVIDHTEILKKFKTLSSLRKK